MRRVLLLNGLLLSDYEAVGEGSLRSSLLLLKRGILVALMAHHPLVRIQDGELLELTLCGRPKRSLGRAGKGRTRMISSAMATWNINSWPCLHSGQSYQAKSREGAHRSAPLIPSAFCGSYGDRRC